MTWHTTLASCYVAASACAAYVATGGVWERALAWTCGNVRNVLGNVSNVSPRTVNVYHVGTPRVRHSNGLDVAVGSAASVSAHVWC